MRVGDLVGTFVGDIVGDLVGKVGDVVGLNDPDIRVGPRVGENVTLDGAFVEVGLVDLKVGAFVG